jgi:hypothetical protein
VKKLEKKSPSPYPPSPKEKNIEMYTKKNQQNSKKISIFVVDKKNCW